MTKLFSCLLPWCQDVLLRLLKETYHQLASLATYCTLYNTMQSKMYMLSKGLIHRKEFRPDTIYKPEQNPMAAEV